MSTKTLSANLVIDLTVVTADGQVEISKDWVGTPDFRLRADSETRLSLLRGERGKF